MPKIKRKLKSAKFIDATNSKSINISKKNIKSIYNEINDEMESDTPLRLGNSSFEELNISEDEEGGYRVGDIYIPPPIKPYCSAESKGPRLIITKIENQNFKSYAGKVTLGPFHHVILNIIFFFY